MTNELRHLLTKNLLIIVNLTLTNVTFVNPETPEIRVSDEYFHIFISIESHLINTQIMAPVVINDIKLGASADTQINACI